MLEGIGLLVRVDISRGGRWMDKLEGQDEL